ncbi:MAG: hypothetical protein CVV39_03150 [Planctomycetes bacterium HGW-Planctomycetes-1]|nr:MAG: hypothetical protein CVV39_03150 [Planctomycetes bacterium HGW-Planctomycetes-1]
MADELTNLKSKEPMSGWIMLIFWWAMLICATHACTRMVGAGDTWVAMACGRHFINHGVDTVEPFSVNSHKPGPTEEEVKTWPKWAQWITDKVGLDTVKYWHPTGWVNQNWLTHVLFYWLTHDSPIADAETFDKPIVEQNITYNSLVYWKYALYILTIIVVYYTGKVLGANPALSAIFACFALFVGRTFLDIRPAGFSNFLTAVLLFVFVLTVYRNYLYIWLVVPITVFWCNLHGGYVYVFLVLVPFIGIHLLTLLPKKISACLYYSLGWLFLYALAVKFRSHAYLTDIKPFEDGLFYFILFAATVSITITIWKNTKAFLFYGCHIITTFIVFVAVCGRFYPQGISRFVAQDNLFKAYVKDGRLTFFVVSVGFVFAAVLLGAFRHRLKTITLKSWWHTVAAAVVAFIAMIIFNPFHLTNLTHTFVISVSEHAKLWKTVNEWHPAFEWSNPVGSAVPFLIMYIIAWVLLVSWIFCLTLKPRLVSKKARPKAESPDGEQYSWPMLDLPLLVIAAMTVYMAIGSRRFIPVAGIAACPVLAMFLDNCIRMLAALVNLRKTGRAVLPDFPMIPQRCLAAGVLAIVLFLTGWWGYWYKTIYLDPWPDNDSLTSVFMRMTASYAKPFKACQFLRDNNLSGTVFNYWTEGGFIAYGQIPNPNTGKTPLQLYMDGRAQAAYDTSAYQKWMHIAAGGEPAKLALRAGRNYTLSDYQAIGEWLDKQFEEDNVWFVFMPLAQFDSEVVKGLETHPNWRVIYMDEDQRIYASIKSEQGKNLYLGMFNGQTKYPDDFSKLFTIGRNLIYIQDEQKVVQGCDFLIQAFAIFPSHGILSELINVAKRLPPLRERIIEVFGQYLDDFVNNKKTYMKQDGYRNRLMAAALISDYFASINRNQPKIAEKYREIVNGFTAEQWRLNKNSRW